MVAQQLEARGVRSPLVLAAMRRVPRHLFVPPGLQKQAYEDHPVNIDCGQTISQPYMVAAMTELLDLRPEHRVLEIGTGSGYQTAILAELAGEVTSIERHAPLAKQARLRLKDLGYANVEILCSDGTLGHPARAPYNAILITAGSPSVPPTLKEQLSDGGTLLCPTGNRELQELVKIIRGPSGYRETKGIRCIFVPLIGREGWPEDMG